MLLCLLLLRLQILQLLLLPPAGPLRVFVTYTNIPTAVGPDSGFDLGGLAGADQKCRTAAAGANLPAEAGRWKAWLSDTTTSAASRLNKNGSPYKLVDGTIIAENWTDLTDGTLQNSIRKTQHGNSYNGEGATRKNAVWTNTSPDGEKASSALKDTCNDWKVPADIASMSDPKDKELASADYTSSVGDYAQKSFSWTATEPNASCYEDNLPIYCFEQIPAP